MKPLLFVLLVAGVLFLLASFASTYAVGLAEILIGLLVFSLLVCLYFLWRIRKLQNES